MYTDSEKFIFGICLSLSLLVGACGREDLDGQTSNVASALEYETYVTDAGRVQMTVTAPKSSPGPLQLALYLHGDTAKDYTRADHQDKYKAFAKEKGIIFVALRSPNRDSWWSHDYMNFVFFDKEFDQAIAKLHEKHNIDKSNYLFAGVSGGSAFLTSVLIPALGNKYPGTYVINCGGNRNNVRGAVTGLDAKKMKMYFYYGSRDFLVQNIGLAMNGYKALGVSIESEVIPNAAHCAYPIPEHTIKAWSQNLVTPASGGDSSANSNSGMFLALEENAANGQEGYFRAAGPAAVRTALLCENMKASECRNASNQAKSLTLLSSSNGRGFFKSASAINLSAGKIVSVLGFDENNKVISEATTIKIEAK